MLSNLSGNSGSKQYVVLPLQLKKNKHTSEMMAELSPDSKVNGMMTLKISSRYNGD
jgi:hypothetical protein